MLTLSVIRKARRGITERANKIIKLHYRHESIEAIKPKAEINIQPREAIVIERFHEIRLFLHAKTSQYEVYFSATGIAVITNGACQHAGAVHERLLRVAHHELLL